MRLENGPEINHLQLFRQRDQTINNNSIECANNTIIAGFELDFAQDFYLVMCRITDVRVVEN